MSTTTATSANWTGASTRTGATRSVPPPLQLTAAQERELESELRRELAALERRLASERQDDSDQSQGVAARDAASATPGVSDIELRRDLVAAALARLDAGVYGSCSHCADPIPFGRLLVMPEATHCLSCSGRS